MTEGQRQGDGFPSPFATHRLSHWLRITSVSSNQIANQTITASGLFSGSGLLLFILPSFVVDFGIATDIFIIHTIY